MASDAQYTPHAKGFSFTADRLCCEIGIPKESGDPLPVRLFFDTGNRYTVVTKAFLELMRVRVKFYDLKETINWGTHTYRRIAEFTVVLGVQRACISAVILEEDPGAWLAMGTEDMLNKEVDFLFSSRQVRFANGSIAPMSVNGSPETFDTYTYAQGTVDDGAMDERPFEYAEEYDEDGTVVGDEEITVGMKI